ncbi:hypothetical protein ABID58_004277 [Bradyrhizobium sp. S3.2.6]
MRDLKRAEAMVTHFRAVGRPLSGFGVAGALLASHKPLRYPSGKTREMMVNVLRAK